MTERIRKLNPISKKLETYFDKSKHKDIDDWLLDASWLIQSMEDEALELRSALKNVRNLIDKFNKSRNDLKSKKNKITLARIKNLIEDYGQYFDKDEEWFHECLEHIHDLEAYINEIRNTLGEDEIYSDYQQYLDNLEKKK